MCQFWQYTYCECWFVRSLVGLHCQAKFDYHPWRLSGLYGLSLQLDNGGGSSHLCPPLDCLKRWQSDHTCHRPHRFNELATKSEKWNGKPRLACVDGLHPPSILWVYCPGHAGAKGNDRADRLTGKATLASGLLLGRPEVLRSLRHYLRAQSQGHHTTDRLEERGVERGSARRSSLKGRERAIVNLTNIGTVSKATLGDTSERRSGAHMGFSESTDNILNWTELNVHSDNALRLLRVLIRPLRQCTYYEYW